MGISLLFIYRLQRLQLQVIQILVLPHEDLFDAVKKPFEIRTVEMVAYPQQIAIQRNIMAKRGLEQSRD